MELEGVSLTSDLVRLDEAGEHREEDGWRGGLGALSEVLHGRRVCLLEPQGTHSLPADCLITV